MNGKVKKNSKIPPVDVIGGRFKVKQNLISCLWFYLQ